MSVTYTEKAKRLLSAAEFTRADAITIKVLDEYPYPPVEANWDVTEDPEGRATFVLRGKDSAGTAQRFVEPDEVRSDSKLRFQLYRLCGDLLRERSRQLIGSAAKSGDFDGPED